MNLRNKRFDSRSMIRRERQPMMKRLRSSGTLLHLRCCFDMKKFPPSLIRFISVRPFRRNEVTTANPRTNLEFVESLSKLYSPHHSVHQLCKGFHG